MMWSKVVALLDILILLLVYIDRLDGFKLTRRARLLKKLHPSARIVEKIRPQLCS